MVDGVLVVMVLRRVEIGTPDRAAHEDGRPRGREWVVHLKMAGRDTVFIAFEWLLSRI